MVMCVVFFSLCDRNYSGGVRTRDTMEAQGAFVKPDYVPPRGSRFTCINGCMPNPFVLGLRCTG